MPRRVVITGLGAVSGFGIGVDPLWAGLCEGRSTLGPVRRFDASGFPCRLASEIADFSAKGYVPKSYRKAVKVMARDTELAVVSAQLAVDDAGLKTRIDEDESEPTYPSERVGCQIGAGLLSADQDELGSAMRTSLDENGTFDLGVWGESGMGNLPPLWMLKYLPNMLACHVTIIHGAKGPSNTITCGEASALLSIGESRSVIERGNADLCFSGGAETKLVPMGLLRMGMAGRIAETGDETDGTKITMPYDPASRGGLIGEGGGILILEEQEAATKRGAKVYAELLGFGAAQSTPPMVPPLDEAERDVEDGLAWAIEAALEDAGIGPDDVDAIVPAGLGIPRFDHSEAGALRAIFNGSLPSKHLVTLTPAIGNSVAAQGGLQAAVAAKMLAEQTLPARIHAGTPAPGLDAGRSESRKAELRHVLVCTSALGGHNAALVLRAV